MRYGYFNLNEENRWETGFPVVYDKGHYIIVKVANKFAGLGQWGIGENWVASSYTPFFEEGDSVEEVLDKLVEHY